MNRKQSATQKPTNDKSHPSKRKVVVLPTAEWPRGLWSPGEGIGLTGLSGSRPLRQSAVLQLQEQHGNIYVQRLLTFKSSLPLLPEIVHRDKDTEEAARGKILDEMTADMNPSEGLKKRIRGAMRAFSLDQLQHMQKAGLKFWGGSGLPPAFDGIARMAKDISTPGEYSNLVRVMRLSDRASTSHIRHELAHAWDHLRAMSKPKPLKGRKAIEGSFANPGDWWSDSKNKQSTYQPQTGGKTKGIKLTVTEMFELYKGRISRRELAFDNPDTREGHSMRSPQEFYAEGYSVFHGPHTTSQMRLRLFAPELYYLLKGEASANKMPVPDETELDKAEKEFGYTP